MLIRFTILLFIVLTPFFLISWVFAMRIVNIGWVGIIIILKTEIFCVFILLLIKINIFTTFMMGVWCCSPLSDTAMVMKSLLEKPIKILLWIFCYSLGNNKFLELRLTYYRLFAYNWLDIVLLGINIFLIAINRG